MNLNPSFFGFFVTVSTLPGLVMAHFHFYIEQLELQSSMEDKLLMEYPDPSTHIRHNYNDRTRRSKFTDIGYIYL